MNRQDTITAAALLGAGLVAGISITSLRQTHAQAVVPAEAKEMRYMLCTTSDANIFKVDTWTGETWALATARGTPAGRWVPLSAEVRVQRNP